MVKSKDGTPNALTSRDATMPLTPSCHPFACHDKRTLTVVDGIRLRACLFGKVGLDCAAFVVDAVQLCSFRLERPKSVRNQKAQRAGIGNAHSPPAFKRGMLKTGGRGKAVSRHVAHAYERGDEGRGCLFIFYAVRPPRRGSPHAKARSATPRVAKSV